LEDCGLVLGLVNRAAPHNRKGNNENEALRDVHHRILTDRGFDWDNPPSEPILWTQQERADLTARLQDYDPGQTWGFKDPRTLFLLDGWFDLVPGLRLAGSFRHPLETAASLTTRDGFSTEKGLGLWQAYNRQMLFWHARSESPSSFPIVFYDSDCERYLAEVQTIAAALGLDASAPIRFRDESLTHHAVALAPPSDCLSLWLDLHGARTPLAGS
jgi:hypothetical protein